MLIDQILTNCKARYERHTCGKCENCSFVEYCPQDCEKCLKYIHNPSKAPAGAPSRKYDCTNMADFYTCKYSCRYASEIIYALKGCLDLQNISEMKVLSFGCGPCTELFAIDYLHNRGELNYNRLEFRGIDYSEGVWKNIHTELTGFSDNFTNIYFYYEDVCRIIEEIVAGQWIPNLIVFQYFFSDMEKHTGYNRTKDFISLISKFFNEKMSFNSYMILNDINLSRSYNGGREYFDLLLGQLHSIKYCKGRFCDENSTSVYYPKGYPYGNGEFSDNTNFFQI